MDKYGMNDKNNVIIADFMGIRYDENRSGHNDSEYYYEDSELEYDTNWNWLMEVVGKIETIFKTDPKINEKSSSFNITSGYVELYVIGNGEFGDFVIIINKEFYPDYFEFVKNIRDICETKHESVYKSCLLFIEEYKKIQTNE